MTNRPEIMVRLAAGERLLLDGATGSELQRRGVDVSGGTSPDRIVLGAWSASANLDAPDTVRAVHRDYLRAGADIVISNSFWTNRPKLATVGLEDRWEEATRAAGELAVQARDAASGDAYVAGGVAPPGSYEAGQLRTSRDGGDMLTRELADQARVLAEAGVDVMLAEYVGSIADCVRSVDACAVVGLPVWLGVRHVTPDGKLQYGESFADLIAALEGHRVDAILPMCTPPERITTAVKALREVWDGPIGAYGTIGYGSASVRPGRWERYETDRRYSPARYAEHAAEWVDLGAQIIGSCCGTDPTYIEAIRSVVKGAS